uniref:Uncharacterized protein n=1 Tax=Pyramimonas obovata TaxID=1411642 RepID=A0A7S0RV46_9CHLO|mmetsp:Transcript_7615/g.15485  ORF Transcript_7615/g.15485 Transcript_7615/m.15485 type:complete len:413 (+) Transcript_7615:242-1480(+)
MCQLRSCNGSVLSHEAWHRLGAWGHTGKLFVGAFLTGLLLLLGGSWLTGWTRDGRTAGFDVLQSSVRRSALSNSMVHRIELAGAVLVPVFDPVVYNYQATVESSYEYATFVVEVYRPEADIRIRARFRGFVNITNDTIPTNATEVIVESRFSDGTGHIPRWLQEPPYRAKPYEFKSHVSSYGNIRNITLGPLDYGFNKITVEAFSAPLEEQSAEIMYSFDVLHPAPDEHLHLTELAPMDPEETCMREERSGVVSTASGRNMWILNHCKSQARHASRLAGEMAPLTRKRPKNIVDFNHLHVLYVPHHYEQVSIRMVPFWPLARVKLGGAEANSSSHASPGILIRDDHQLVKVTVDAQDGRQGIYHIHIVRLAALPPPPPSPPLPPPHHPPGDVISYDEYLRDKRQGKLRKRLR